MKISVKNIAVFIRNLVFTLFFLFRMLVTKMLNPKWDFIYTEGYFSFSWLRFKKNNWGDDLNKYFFEYVTNKKIINYPFSKTILIRKIKTFSLIGSIVTFYDLDGKVVYGSGIMNPNRTIRNKPSKIISVRGPETRRVLLERGIKCPEHYGDPALLLPLFYVPKKKKINKGGLILNMGTGNDELMPVLNIINDMNLVRIDMRDYQNWTDVIDEICSCDYILSESLHGLIVAETYGIPNVWVEFKDHPDYWNFKFEDYYGSIGKEEHIIKLQDLVNTKTIKSKINKWEKGNIDYKKLLSYFPFEIKCPINNEVLTDNA